MEDASAKEIVTRIWGTARHNSPWYECLVASPMPYKFGAYLGGERASANGGLGIIIRYHTSATLKLPFNHINSKAAHDGHKYSALWLWVRGPTNREVAPVDWKAGLFGLVKLDLLMMAKKKQLIFPKQSADHSSLAIETA